MATDVRPTPGPRGVPLLGNLPAFAKDPLGFLAGMREVGDIVEWRFGRTRSLLLTRPDYIAKVLIGAERVFTHPPKLNASLILFFGDGMAANSGDRWRYKRSLVQPAFRPGQVHEYARTMVECTAEHAAQWSPGDRVEAKREMHGLTQRIAVRTLFGVDMTGREQTIGAAMDVGQHELGAEFRGLGAVLPNWVPTPGRRRLRAAMAEVDAEVMQAVALARASTDERLDFISRLLAAGDEQGRQLSDRDVRDEAVSMYVAGAETTGTTLTWAWYLLSRDPAALGRLQEELDRVLGGRLPGIDDYDELSWTQYVIKEVLRLYPPFWILTWVALEDTTLGGCRIPEGTRLAASQWSIHRDPRWFDAPEEFHPERWEPQAAAAIPENAWYPFGGGPRVCIGARFAMVEAVLALATIAQHYTLEVDPGEVEAVPSFMLQPSTTMPATVRKV